MDMDELYDKLSNKVEKVHETVNEVKLDVRETNTNFINLKETVDRERSAQKETNNELYGKVDNLDSRQTKTAERLNSHLRNSQTNNKKIGWLSPTMVKTIFAGIIALVVAIIIALAQAIKET